MANQSVRLKEEQLRREEDKLREIEFKVQREIQIKRQELLAKEDSLKVLEARLGEHNMRLEEASLTLDFSRAKLVLEGLDVEFGVSPSCLLFLITTPSLVPSPSHGLISRT